MENGNTTHTISGFGTYIFAWIALVALAAASIILSDFFAGGAGIIIALIIASLKAALVLYFFMHLRYEGLFLKLAFLLPILVLAFSIGFTFLDVLYR